MAHLIGVQGAEGDQIPLLDKTLGGFGCSELHHRHLGVLVLLGPEQSNVCRAAAGRRNETYDVVEGHVSRKVLYTDKLGKLPTRGPQAREREERGGKGTGEREGEGGRRVRSLIKISHRCGAHREGLFALLVPK